LLSPKEFLSLNFIIGEHTVLMSQEWLEFFCFMVVFIHLVFLHCLLA